MWAQWLKHIGSVSPWHVGFSWKMDRTSIPCIERQISNLWTTRGAPHQGFLKSWEHPVDRYGSHYHGSEMTFSHYSGKRQRLPATKISCETRFLPLVDNSPWKQYPVLGDYGPLFWKSIIFWNVFLLAKATSFSVAIFDMGFFFPFTVIDLKKKTTKYLKLTKMQQLGECISLFPRCHNC